MRGPFYSNCQLDTCWTQLEKKSLNEGLSSLSRSLGMSVGDWLIILTGVERHTHGEQQHFLGLDPELSKALLCPLMSQDLPSFSAPTEARLKFPDAPRPSLCFLSPSRQGPNSECSMLGGSSHLLPFLTSCHDNRSPH